MSDTDEEQQIHELLDSTVTALRDAAGDMQGIRAAIVTYCRRGEELCLSPLHLWDYFAISHPGLPDKAGYSAAEVEETTELFEEVTSELWG